MAINAFLIITKRPVRIRALTQENVWHALDVEEIFKTLETSERGLTNTEAEKRFGEYGANELKKRKRISPLQIFLGQFKNIFRDYAVGCHLNFCYYWLV